MNINPNNIPEELRESDRWLLKKDNDLFYFDKSLEKLMPANKQNPFLFMSFADALVHCNDEVSIGIVLTDDDNYACINLIVYDESYITEDFELMTSEKEMTIYHDIVSSFDSYTEVYAKDKGYKILCKGFVGAGIKNNGIEVFSENAFVEITGNVVRRKPIRSDCQDMLFQLIARINTEDSIKINEEIERLDNDTILRKIKEGEYGKKFMLFAKKEKNDINKKLGMRLRVEEIDFFLAETLFRYCKSREQCAQIFSYFPVSKREVYRNEKGKFVKEKFDTVMRRVEKAYYDGQKAIDDKIMRMQHVILSNTNDKLKARSMTSNAIDSKRSILETISPLTSLKNKNISNIDVFSEDVAFSMARPSNPEFIKAGHEGLRWPSGFAGSLCEFIFSNSVRPIKEVSIVTALGILAGICGRSWNIPKSGLNLYLILIAEFGVGKEAMHEATSTLVHKCSETYPWFKYFFYFGDFSSGPAIKKHMESTKSFVNLSGELGRKIGQLINSENGPNSTKRTVLMDVYQKSSKDAMMAGHAYARKDKSVMDSTASAMSILGESTPTSFYDSLTKQAMEDGFLSRFSVIEYHGGRAKINENLVMSPPVEIVNYLVSMAKFSRQKILNGTAVLVNTMANEEVSKLLSDFEDSCDRKINSTTNPAIKQLWNRASLKVQKISALLAVGNNFTSPKITKDDVNWAIHFVKYDIDNFLQRIKKAQLGRDDFNRELSLIRVLKEFPSEKKFNRDDFMTNEMVLNGIITHSYISRKLSDRHSFMIVQPDGRSKSKHLISNTVKSFVAQGYLDDIDSEEVCKLHGLNDKVRCYRISASFK